MCASGQFRPNLCKPRFENLRNCAVLAEAGHFLIKLASHRWIDGVRGFRMGRFQPQLFEPHVIRERCQQCFHVLPESGALEDQSGMERCRSSHRQAQGKGPSIGLLSALGDMAANEIQ